MVQLGCERLLASNALDGKRVGLVCNPASVDSRLEHVADLFAQHPRAHLAALFGPQHGFRSDVQDNMIETRHGQDEVRRVPVYSLYSETREPTAKMLAGLDALVIDLQDVGSRIYTFIYTMANCLIARAQARREGHRLRPAQPDRRRRGRRTDARARLRVVRRAVPDSDASRDDDWRAGAALQRGVRDRRGPRSRPHGGMAAGDVFRRDLSAVGDAVAEHADPRLGRGVSGLRALRGHQRVGGPRHDAAVRARRRAVGDGRAVCRRHEPRGPSRRALPAGGLRADIPEALADGVRRLPAARHGSARRSDRSRQGSR